MLESKWPCAGICTAWFMQATQTKWIPTSIATQIAFVTLATCHSQTTSSSTDRGAAQEFIWLAWADSSVASAGAHPMPFAG